MSEIRISEAGRHHRRRDRRRHAQGRRPPAAAAQFCLRAQDRRLDGEPRLCRAVAPRPRRRRGRAGHLHLGRCQARRGGAERAARHPDRPRVQLSRASRPDRADRKEPGRPGDSRGARCRVAAGDQRSERRRSEASRPPICRKGAWSPSPDQLVFTGNGRQSIAAALASVVPTGGRCGVEALTYPFVKGIAARLGISLVPLAMDEGRRAARLGAKGASRGPSLGHLHSAGGPESAGHDDDRGAPRRSAARRREARPSGHRGQCLRLPRP